MQAEAQRLQAELLATESSLTRASLDHAAKKSDLEAVAADLAARRAALGKVQAELAAARSSLAVRVRAWARAGWMVRDVCVADGGGACVHARMQVPGSG